MQILLVILFVGILALWIKTIIEIANSEFDNDSRTIWLLVVILVGVIGMIIYYAAGRQHRITEASNSGDVIDNF